MTLHPMVRNVNVAGIKTCIKQKIVAAFVQLLHEAVTSGLEDGVDDMQKNGAIQLQQGWMHIHGRILFSNCRMSDPPMKLRYSDERNPPPLGRIGDADDILGTVLVENGEVNRLAQHIDVDGRTRTHSI